MIELLKLNRINTLYLITPSDEKNREESLNTAFINPDIFKQ